MTPFEIGKVSAFLLKHRKIEERSERRAIAREEKDLAGLLRDAPMDAMQVLQDMMPGYGFDLVTLTSFDVKGIPPNSRVYLLVRRSNAECPLLDTSRTAERMDPGSGKVTAAKIWFTQIWLMHLDLLYTRRDRGPRERNQWLEASFSKDQLVQSMREHINGHVRRLNPLEVAQSEVYRTLTAEKGADLERYVNRFLALMLDGAMLDEIGQNVYRQSLLSAVEMKENYERILAPLMLDLLGQQGEAGLTHTAQALLTERLDDMAETTRDVNP